MTLTELIVILKATGYPIAYSHFSKTPTVPFITYSEFDSTNFLADNRTYKQVRNIQVELYTDKKDIQAESTIEALLNAYELPYQTLETYIESEQLFQRIYEIGVI
jgi:hypothetical protein